MIRAAGIICKPIKDIVSSVVPPLMEWLRSHKVEVLIDQETQACVGVVRNALSRDALAKKSTC